MDKHKQKSNLGNVLKSLAVLAVSFTYLVASGGRHMYLDFISHGFKMQVAAIVEVVALVLVVYFIIRLIIGLFVKEKVEPSPELKAIERLSTGLNTKLDSIKGLLENKQTDNKDNADKE